MHQLYRTVQIFKNVLLVFFSGKYPCPCGVRDEVFRNSALFNQKGPFDSLESRLKMVNETRTWKDGAKEGNIAVFENLKVRCFEYRPSTDDF